MVFVKEEFSEKKIETRVVFNSDSFHWLENFGISFVESNSDFPGFPFPHFLITGWKEKWTLGNERGIMFRTETFRFSPQKIRHFFQHFLHRWSAKSTLGNESRMVFNKVFSHFSPKNSVRNENSLAIFSSPMKKKVNLRNRDWNRFWTRKFRHIPQLFRHCFPSPMENNLWKRAKYKFLIFEAKWTLGIDTRIVFCSKFRFLFRKSFSPLQEMENIPFLCKNFTRNRNLVYHFFLHRRRKKSKP